MTGRTPPAKILVVFSKADIVHRKMLEGILRYVREKCIPGWEVQLDLRDIYRRSSAELASGGFAGIIAAVATAPDRRRYLATKLPTVFFEPTLARMDDSARPANNVTFFNDHTAEGRAAAKYYLDRGYRSFAYVGLPNPTAWSVARGRGFTSMLAKAGFRTALYHPPDDGTEADFTLEAPRLAKWLRRLPRHTALFATHDERALQVLSVARRVGISVPEDLALLGVDDDELLCSTAPVPLSSIPVSAADTGWRIAQAMHSLLRGENHDAIIRTCHTRVITRLSTDAYALQDPIVAKAVDFAEKHLSEPIGVKALAEAAHCSVRTLQMKMLKVLRTTPKDELSFIRRTNAARLLSETPLPISEVAARCGYCSASHLGTCMKKAFGASPSKLRHRSVHELRRP